MRALITISLALVFATANADNHTGTLKRIADTGEFRIGYVPDAAPLSFDDSQAGTIGYSIDLCKHIASSIQKQLELEELNVTFTPLVSIEERISAIENGDVDIECGATTVTLARRERVDFTLTTFVTGSAVLSRKASPIDGVDDLDGGSVAVVKGTTTESIIRKVIDINEFEVKLHLVASHDDGMKLLNDRKVDGYVSDRAMLIGQVFRNANAQNNYVMTRAPLSFEPYAMMIPRGDSDFRLAADRALAQLFSDARIRRIYQNWFGRFGETMSPIVEAVYQLQAVGE
jgi:glutamate/aspartate transport system substrate-binding protein